MNPKYEYHQHTFSASAKQFNPGLFQRQVAFWLAQSEEQSGPCQHIAWRVRNEGTLFDGLEVRLIMIAVPEKVYQETGWTIHSRPFLDTILQDIEQALQEVA